MIGAEGFVMFVVYGVFLNDADVLGKFVVRDELRLSDSEFHFDDVFLNVPSGLKHLNLELVDGVEIFLSKLDHLPLNLTQKFVDDHWLPRR